MLVAGSMVCDLMASQKISTSPKSKWLRTKTTHQGNTTNAEEIDLLTSNVAD